MRFRNVLLLSGLLIFVLTMQAYAAQNGFKEYKLAGLTIDLPADWKPLPKEFLEQMQKKTGAAKLLMLAQGPDDNMPKLTIMEQANDTLSQKEFAELSEADIKEQCDGTKQSVMANSTDFQCKREKSDAGTALSVVFLMPGNGKPDMRTYNMIFHRGAKITNVTVLFPETGSEKMVPQVEAILQSIRLNDK